MENVIVSSNGIILPEFSQGRHGTWNQLSLSSDKSFWKVGRLNSSYCQVCVCVCVAQMSLINITRGIASMM